MRVLFIHGRSQGGKDPIELRRAWIEAFNAGLTSAGVNLPSSVVFDFPYYAEVLDDFVSRSKERGPGGVVEMGMGSSNPRDEFIAQALHEIARQGEISEREIQALVEGPPVTEQGPQNWRWVRALARAVDRRFTDGASWTIEKFLADVHLYISNERVQRAVNKVVEDALTNEPTVVVGHSLGSVVGYRVLLENSSSPNILRYVTVGSPLGIRAISTRLGVPTHVGEHNWFNAFDRRDIVALNPLERGTFTTDPAIINHRGVNNSTENRHGITGYLDDPKVARAIVEAFTT